MSFPPPATISELPGSSSQAPIPTGGASFWYPPLQAQVNNLTLAVNGTGTYGFIFTSSVTPDEEYGTYNWCNMPHVRKTEYIKPPDEYQLIYVELMHRHHKRTPYSSNAFPVEMYHWDCDDEKLFNYGQSSGGPAAASVYSQGFTSEQNPFIPSGWIGTCQFPQITADGLQDSWQHGVDLYEVYHSLLGLLPARNANISVNDSRVKYRVTNNPITSQVAGMAINGMWDTCSPIPVLVEARGIDSLEPQYLCPKASALFLNMTSSSNKEWQQHLDAAKPIYEELDNVSGVPPDDASFHVSFDHYYDNLSARQCHEKALPCKLVDGLITPDCVSQDLANTVYRLGNWEYSYMYRDNPDSLAASAASLGVWLAELTSHMRDVMSGKSEIVYFHNIAHDGSVSRLLSTLQVNRMVWPGMGAEVVFELYKKKKEAAAAAAAQNGTSELQASLGASKRNQTSGVEYYVRVLFGGKILESSNPTLGPMEMVPIEIFLGYLDDLVGTGGNSTMNKCQIS